MVSLIIPCYNSEIFIERCINSVLSQIYKNIELILINDGSTDATEEIIKKLKDKIEQHTMRYIYTYQVNKGVGAACNAGFKQASGKYLMLLDSDDALCPDSVQKCVEYLDKHLDFSLVRTNGYYVTEDEMETSDRLLETNSDMKTKTNIFDDVFCGSTYVWPGTYMIRMNVLDQLYPNREIYPSRGGQNLQFLMMACYHRKAGFLDEPLMRYTVRSESLSHFDSGDILKKEIQAMERYRDIREHLIEEFMQGTEKKYWLDRVNHLYANIYVQLACKNRNKIEAKKYFEALKNLEKPNLNISITYYRLMNPVKYILLRLGRKIRFLR